MLWMDWGLLPDSMLGHSIGEYVAATLAGVFTLPDVLRLVAARGRLMQSLPPGAMLAVRLPCADVLPLMTDGLSIAAVNSPSVTVVSGTTEAVTQFDARATALGVQCRRLHTSHAFHSAMMNPILDVYREEFDGVQLESPSIPFVSNLSGTWITSDQAKDAGYWVRHLRQGVQFASGVSKLLETERRALVEVGPGTTLSTLAVQNTANGRRTILSSFPHLTSEASQAEHLNKSLGKLWEFGAAPDWSAVHRGELRRRLELPTYPFERKRHWVEPTNVHHGDAKSAVTGLKAS